MTEDKPELETQTAPETAPEPISEPATAVVTRAEIILDRLAEQQQLILDELRRLDDSGVIADQLRTLQHDVTVLSGLLPTVAHAQTAILDQITALRDEMRIIRGQLARLDNQNLLDELRAARQALDRVPDVVMNRWADTLLAAAKTPG